VAASLPGAGFAAWDAARPGQGQPRSSSGAAPGGASGLSRFGQEQHHQQQQLAAAAAAAAARASSSSGATNESSDPISGGPLAVAPLSPEGTSPAVGAAGGLAPPPPPAPAAADGASKAEGGGGDGALHASLFNALAMLAAQELQQG
jgi:hypothetical protein